MRADEIRASNWVQDVRGFNCYTCGAFCKDNFSIPDIERDCLRCWSLNAAKKEGDAECTVMPPRSGQTLMELAESLQTENAGLKAGMEQLRRIPEVVPLAREVELLMVLKKFMDFQISDYDRVANRAKDYCAIRREARLVLQRYSPSGESHHVD